FGDFESSLGIAKNILAARLQHLVDHGIFERVDVGSEGHRFEYRLTEKGEALLPVLTTLREWSDEWVFGRGHEPVIVHGRRTGRRMPRLRVSDADGRTVSSRDLRTVPGPGASKETIRRLTPRVRRSPRAAQPFPRAEHPSDAPSAAVLTAQRQVFQ